MNQSILCLIGIIVFSISLIGISYGQQTNSDNLKTYIHVQSILRNSNGELIAYLASNKFTHIDQERLDNLLDFEASLGNAPIVTFEGKKYQLIRRAQILSFSYDTVIANTALGENVEGEVKFLVKFAHDGYIAKPGDTLESLWTFLRPLP